MLWIFIALFWISWISVEFEDSQQDFAEFYSQVITIGFLNVFFFQVSKLSGSNLIWNWKIYYHSFFFINFETSYFNNWHINNWFLNCKPHTFKSKLKVFNFHPNNEQFPLTYPWILPKLFKLCSEKTLSEIEKKK